MNERGARRKSREAGTRDEPTRSSRMNKPLSAATTAIRGEEHWMQKGSEVRLFLWNKHSGDPSGPAGRILFVHGSSMASPPTFDLHVPGRADSSAMDFFAARGYDTWCVHMEGDGRSPKTRENKAPIPHGARDCFAAPTDFCGPPRPS